MRRKERLSVGGLTVLQILIVFTVIAPLVIARSTLPEFKLLLLLIGAGWFFIMLRMTLKHGGELFVQKFCNLAGLCATAIMFLVGVLLIANNLNGSRWRSAWESGGLIMIVGSTLILLLGYSQRFRFKPSRVHRRLMHRHNGNGVNQPRDSDQPHRAERQVKNGRRRAAP
jgi:hypothetical protein